MNYSKIALRKREREPQKTKHMPFPIAAAIGAGVSLAGMAIAGGKDKRQLKQQNLLMQQQMTGEKEMMDYQQQLQMENWETTGYGGQKDQMKRAGINPALMYGMGGGGGQTIGTQSANVTGGQAPAGSGREFEDMSAMGMQLASQIALQKAQRENIEADTDNKRAQAAKTAGVDTKLAESTTARTNVDTDYLTQTLGNRISQAVAEAVKSVQQGQQEVNNTNVSDRTKESRISQIHAEAYGQILENALTEAKKTEIGSKIEVNNAAINKMARDIEQRGQEIDIKTFEAQLKANFPGIDAVGGNLIQMLFDAIDKVRGKGPDRMPLKVN